MFFHRGEGAAGCPGHRAVCFLIFSDCRADSRPRCTGAEPASGGKRTADASRCGWRRLQVRNFTQNRRVGAPAPEAPSTHSAEKKHGESEKTAAVQTVGAFERECARDAARRPRPRCRPSLCPTRKHKPWPQLPLPSASASVTSHHSPRKGALHLGLGLLHRSARPFSLGLHGLKFTPRVGRKLPVKSKGRCQATSSAGRAGSARLPHRPRRFRCRSARTRDAGRV